jgi:CBS domain containing-hemolysin-like protein
MEDILEEVVGKVRTETQESGFVFEKLGPGKWRISGAMSVDDFRREYPHLREVPGAVTMGGVMTSVLEVVPQAGETVSLGELRLTAHSVDERHVRELLVEVRK